MTHTTYILYSASLDRYYVGSTSQSFEVRLMKHLSNHSGYTARSKDWELIYKVEFKSIKEARSQEKIIKKRGAKRFLSTITS